MGDDELASPEIYLDGKPLVVVDSKDVHWKIKTDTDNKVIGEDSDWAHFKPSDGLSDDGSISFSFTISNFDYKRFIAPEVKGMTRNAAKTLNAYVKAHIIGGRLPRKKKKIMKKLNAKIIAKYWEWDYYQILHWLKAR